MSTKHYIDYSARLVESREGTSRIPMPGTRNRRRLEKQGTAWHSMSCRINGHIVRRDTGRVYKGLGLKDLQRRLDYWEARVADFAAMAAEAEGDAKKSAAKLLKSGEKLLKTIRGEVAQRYAA